MNVTKSEVAHRQLNFAIELLSHDADSVATHTLAGAASNLFSDLVECKCPDKSWDKMAQEDNNLNPGQFFNILRKAQNFFKHALLEPDAKLDFKPTETEDLLFFAVMNAGELGKLSIPESLYQLWYLAAKAEILGSDYPFVAEALSLFPDLPSFERPQRLEIGRVKLNNSLL